MDCKYIHHTPKKKFKIDFTQQTDSKQIVNPPLIHSLASNSSMIAAGLGNSKCHLIDAQRLVLELNSHISHTLRGCLENHSYIVNQV
jgi:hypothetical protein